MSTEMPLVGAPPGNVKEPTPENLKSIQMDAREDFYNIQYRLGCARRLHASKVRKMNTDWDDKYEDDVEKENAFNAIKKIEGDLDIAKEAFITASKNYRTRAAAVKEQQRSTCTIS